MILSGSAGIEIVVEFSHVRCILGGRSISILKAINRGDRFMAALIAGETPPIVTKRTCWCLGG